MQTQKHNSLPRPLRLGSEVAANFVKRAFVRALAKVAPASNMGKSTRQINGRHLQAWCLRFALPTRCAIAQVILASISSESLSNNFKWRWNASVLRIIQMETNRWTLPHTLSPNRHPCRVLALLFSAMNGTRTAFYNEPYENVRLICCVNHLVKYLLSICTHLWVSENGAKKNIYSRRRREQKLC